MKHTTNDMRNAAESWLNRASAYTEAVMLVEAAAEIDRLRAACQLRIDDWDACTQPGAVGEGCGDPEDVAAMRAALAAEQAGGGDE